MSDFMLTKHSEEEMRKALRSFIDKDFSLHSPVDPDDPDMVIASAIEELMEFRGTSILVSELREWCEERNQWIMESQSICSLDILAAKRAVYETILTKFCGGK